MQPSPSPRGQSPRSGSMGTPLGHSIRASPSRDSAVYSRESTPGHMSDPATPGSISDNLRRSVGPPDGHNDSAEYRDASPRKIDVVGSRNDGKEMITYAALNVSHWQLYQL